MNKKTLFFSALIALLLTASCQEIAQKQVNDIQTQVAKDYEARYEIAIKNNNLTDAYTQASITAAAYLQAKDEANYLKWKAITNDLAVKIGMPVMN